MNRKIIVFLLTAVLQTQAGTTYYVDASRPNDSGAGTSWSLAKKTIQAAVNLATAGSIVLVTNGVYSTGTTITPGYALSNRVVITKAITVRSLNGPEVTFIEGSGTNFFDTRSAVRCVFMTNGVLDGFTLRNGATYGSSISGNYYYDRSGGGVNMYGSTVDTSLTNCVISNCIAEYSGGGCSYGTLNCCTLTGNSCTLTAKVYAEGGGSFYSTLNNCLLTRNVALSGGGSFYSTLNNCILTENTASSGGGSYNGTLNNCILTENTAVIGGGSQASTLNNCTLTRNTAAFGGGLFAGTLRNCIVWGNFATSDDNYSGTVFASFTCTSPLPTLGAGNISTDPLFINPSRGDFDLSIASPCINAGANSLAIGFSDVNGNPRNMDGTVDMGAYEALPRGQVLNSSNLVWNSGGDAYWFGQAAVTADGYGAIQSGPIDNSQNTWIQAETEGKGLMQFKWQISSESGDYLRFYADGQAENAISGTTVWQTVTLSVTNVGEHTFRWEYTKGKSGAAGDDAGWLDEVSWVPVMANVSVFADPVDGGSVSGGGTYISGSSITLEANANRGWCFTGWENGELNSRRIVTVPEDAITCTAHFVQTTIPLNEALDTTNLIWSTGGDLAWSGWTLAMAHDGEDAARSGVIGDTNQSYIQTMVYGAGTLSFWWRVSCEADFDYFDFKVNGSVRKWLTGESGWQHVVLQVDSGTNSLEWVYWKDESVAGGEDAAWLDQVFWSADKPVLSGYALWAVDKGLTGNLAATFCADRNSDGVANGFEYAFGTNLVSDVPLLNIRMIGGRPVLETFMRDPNSTNDVEVTVQGCTNLYLGGWTIPVGPAADTAGKPEGREWFEPQGEVFDKAFFRLHGELK